MIALKKILTLNSNTVKMGASQKRDELHEFIEHADERLLNLLYGMMRADDTDKEILTPEQLENLTIRIERHQSGKSKSYSWPEARAIIEKVK
jgi:hypothetical protein